jgi:ABC-type glutathione transport system ATPase component
VTVPAVRARDLSLQYRAGLGRPPVAAITGLSLDIAPGETLAVIGDAGSGKSTLARAIAGYTSRSVEGGVEVAGGVLEVLGVDVRRLGRRGDDQLALRVGYVPQDAGLVLDPHLTVAENVALPLFLRDRGFSKKAAGSIAAEAIDTMHLTLATMPKFPHELSRGQRQRVAIARALVLEPELLVADEATAGIDATIRGAILAHLAEAQRQRGFAAFVISSEIGEVRRLANQLAVLHRGTIVGFGTVDTVLDYPHHPCVQRLAELARARA